MGDFWVMNSILHVSTTARYYYYTQFSTPAQSQQQMYREIQEELRRGSSIFLDLAREQVENEEFGKDENSQ